MNDHAPATPADEESHWAGWPTCPECQARRQTLCTVCQVAGSDFPLAEFSEVPETPQIPWDESSPEAAARDQTVMLVCPTCDEAFHPVFYRRCAWCGHDFGRGREDRLADSEAVELNPRVLLIIALLAGGFIAILGYFWFVLNA